MSRASPPPAGLEHDPGRARSQDPALRGGVAAAAQSTYLRRRGEEAGTGAGLAGELGRPQRAGRGKRSPSHPSPGAGLTGISWGGLVGGAGYGLEAATFPQGRGACPGRVLRGRGLFQPLRSPTVAGRTAE